MSEPSGLRVCCRGKKEGTNKNSGKTEVENRTIRSEVLNTYSLYYLLSKSIGGNIYWQCNFQTETRQSVQENTCQLSHLIRLSGVIVSDYLLCLKTYTYAEQLPRLVSLSALNNSLECML